MAQITSGRVVYSRTVQPAEYESRRVEVELAFVIEDNEDPDQAIREVAAIVRREALALVHQPDRVAPEPARVAPVPGRVGRRKFQARGRDE